MEILKYYMLLFWANRKAILSGVWHSVLALFFPKRYQWVRERKALCDECIFNSRHEFAVSKTPGRRDAHCVLCECNLYLKQHSPCSNCGIEKLPQGILKWESRCHQN